MPEHRMTCNDITEILLKVVLNTNQNQPIQARETAVPVGKLKFNRI
jgi:hypothetical protein